MSQFLSPDKLREITSDAEMEEHRELMAKRRLLDEAAGEMKRAFEARDLTPETPERINNAIREAARRGEHEVLVLRFPATFCKDGGRRINNFEKDWPESLAGFSGKAYDYFKRELEPLGFTMRAEIMNFPEGNMGDVGLYLRW